jgi:hypothetical protein
VGEKKSTEMDLKSLGFVLNELFLEEEGSQHGEGTGLLNYGGGIIINGKQIIVRESVGSSKSRWRGFLITWEH